jgi:hypothetical protein
MRPGTRWGVVVLPAAAAGGAAAIRPISSAAAEVKATPANRRAACFVAA